MTEDIHIHIHTDQDDRTGEILLLVKSLQRKADQMASDLTDLTAKVTAAATVDQSAITLLEGLSAEITAAGTDPAALAALTTQLDASTQALAAAVTANSPVTPPAA